MNGTTETKSGARTFLLRQLHLFGLDHLDAVILSALADERPMLLIGPHGTAKSEIPNRLAQTLELSHRHYNASLLSFDDLLGYPVLQPGRQELTFLETEATVWGAESIFLDEISRCRPETANKLFSLIHERRIQGRSIPQLRYRWSAMNPPPSDDGMDEAEEGMFYSGSLPLDPALADRFAWVLPIPAIQDLPLNARRMLIAGGGGKVLQPPPLRELVADTKKAFQRFPKQNKNWVVDWALALTEAMQGGTFRFSGRRAVFLRDSVRWIFAASQALGEPLALENAALEALRYGIPHRAQGMRIEPETIVGIHRKACEIANSRLDSALRQVLAENNPVRRILLALPLREKEADRTSRSEIVLDALAGLPKPERHLLCILLGRHPDAGRLNARAIELVAEPIAQAMQFAANGEQRVSKSRTKAPLWDRIMAAIVKMDENKEPDRAMLGNMLMLLFSADETFEPGKLLQRFFQWRELFEPSRQKDRRKTEVAA